MLANVLGWLKALSIAKKVGLGVSTLFVASAVASPGTQPVAPTLPNNQDVKSAVQQEVTEKKIETMTQDIVFSTESVNDPNMDKGTTAVTTTGVAGLKLLTYEVIYVNGIEISRELIKEKVTREPITEVTNVGTYVAPAAPQTRPVKNCDPNYSPCVPNVSYDLDCPDIGFSVRILGSDPHGFDGNDNDGFGCESY